MSKVAEVVTFMGEDFDPLAIPENAKRERSYIKYDNVVEYMQDHPNRWAVLDLTISTPHSIAQNLRRRGMQAIARKGTVYMKYLP